MWGDINLEEENPGGSFSVEGKPLQYYIKKYSQLGNHVKRYKFTKPFVTGKDVIEFGCGYGAGAIILKKFFKSYLGLDIDHKAINYAKENICTPDKKIEFMTLSEFNKVNLGRKFDVALSFEVIEHILDTDWFLSFLKLLTKKNGKIILSTPNGLSSNGNKALYRSQYHVKEYTPVEFLNILSSHGTARFYGERRIDKMDIKTLLNRTKALGDIKSKTEQEKASVSMGDSIFFKLANRFLNGSIFWKINSLEPTHETHLSYSTIIAVLIP